MNEQEKIGAFIKDLREGRGMTQEALAKALATSQSAVARMEAGKQNFTTKELARVSEALERRILIIPESTDFRIEGGRQLSGSIATNYSKNGSVVLLCAALLNRGKTILHGISRIEEVNRLIEVLESIDVSIRWTGKNTIEIIPPSRFDLSKLDTASAARICAAVRTGSGVCGMGNRAAAARGLRQAQPERGWC